MPTLVLNAYSKAYPSISNRIRASVSLEAYPQAIVSEIIDSTIGHPQKVWSFPGLQRQNYRFSLDSIDEDGNAVNNLALFSVVPGLIEGSLVRDDEQIEVGQTIGLVSGESEIYFDGAVFNKRNYLGWEIVISEIGGRGIMIRGVDYSWNKINGFFKLLQDKDKFQPGQYYNVHFNPIDATEGNSYPTLNDYQFNFLENSATITPGHFGKKLICSPLSDYMYIRLPNAITVVEGRKLMIEVESNNMCCVEILTASGEPVNFFNGLIFLYPGERLTIYVMIKNEVPEYRYCEAFGNFLTVGNCISSDHPQTELLTMLLLNGAELNIKKYSRLYKDFVLNLPINQVVSYSDWSLGNNKYYYSYSDSNLDTGKFHIPDRRSMFERNNNNGKPGDFFDHQILTHQHITQSGGINDLGFGGFGKTILNYFLGIFSGPGQGKRDITSIPTSNNGSFLGNVGSETRPVNVLINKYVLI